MIKRAEFQKASIRYSDVGSGSAVVFLHGYLLSLEVWQNFVSHFSEHYRVICVDLPGHGESELPDAISTMEVMAATVAHILDVEKIEKATVFGHSMGGYAALALLESRPDLLSGIGLFHSHTFADSDEVKKKRDREVKLIEQGHKNLLVSQSLPNMFATDRIEKFGKQLEDCKLRAQHMKAEEIVAAVKGLKARKDRSEILAQASIPCLNIIGKKDNFISFEDVALKVPMPLNADYLISEKTGHMGFFEDPEAIGSGILQFLNKSL